MVAAAFSVAMCEKIKKVALTFSVLLTSLYKLMQLATAVALVKCYPSPQVNSWLSAVFGDQPVPHFEVNTRTVDILYQLAQSSEARCSDTALLTEDLKQKTSEYQAEGECVVELDAVKFGLLVLMQSRF